MRGSRSKPPDAAPAGLRAERFEIDGVEYVVFEWDSARSLSALSPSERAVCELLLAGLSNAEIARRRQTSVRTIANQVAAILKKLEVASRFELVSAFSGVAKT